MSAMMLNSVFMSSNASSAPTPADGSVERMVMGYDLDVIAIIGIVLLIGIVKKNAIMMIDFALDAERTRGLSSRDAIFEACLLRFRPIMMTTMAALLGALPLAIGRGAGAELRQPLGITIVGGLLFSQLLTLFTTPVVYLYLDRLSEWLQGHGRSRAEEGQEGHGDTGSSQPELLAGSIAAE